MVGGKALFLLGCATLAYGGAAAAQTSPTTGGDRAAASQAAPATPDAGEIVVTASKRAERLQDVPIAITVVQGAQLARQNVVDIAGLTRSAPALNVAGPYGAYSIRGIGSLSFSRSAEGSVGVVVDGVALANTSGNPPQLFDVQRIEVLAGPQGTLFGRNSSAGVLNIVTNDPDPTRFEARAQANIGTRNNQIVQAVANLPVSATSALRVSGSFTNSPHVMRNRFDGRWTQNEAKSGRARFKWEPTDRVTINLIGDYSRVDLQAGSSWVIYRATPTSPIGSRLAACGVRVRPDNDEGCQDGATGVHNTAWGTSAQVDMAFGDYTLTSISAFRHFSQKGIGQDADSVPVNFLNNNYSPFSTDNFSQEVRLTSPATGPLTFVAGLYYFDAEIASANRQAGFPLGDVLGITPRPPGAPPITNPLIIALLNTQVGQNTVTRSKLKSVAAFGQATLRITRRLRLLGGVRVGREQADAFTSRTPLSPTSISIYPLPAPFGANAADTYVSYKGGAEFDVSRRIMAYATYTRGYKGPSINDQATTTTVPLIVRPEVPHNAEIGLKTTLLRGRLTANLAAYHNRVDDFQAQFFDPGSSQFVFSNAPKLTSKGVSLDVTGQPVRWLSLNAGVLYNDAKYGSGYIVQCAQQQSAANGCVAQAGTRGITDAGGNRLIGAPLWKVTASGEVRHDFGDRVQGFLDLDLVHQSRINFSAAFDPINRIPAATVVGGKLGVRTQDQRFGIAAFARNIFDKRLAVVRFEAPTANSARDPSAYAQIFGDESFRVVGVSLDARF